MLLKYPYKLKLSKSIEQFGYKYNRVETMSEHTYLLNGLPLFP